jgi:cardiolipin synthase A/B
MDFNVLAELWPALVAIGTIVISVLASSHALLHKRDTRSAVAWVGFVWFVPVVGAILYVLLGINRIRRAAQALRPKKGVAALPPLRRTGTSNVQLAPGAEHLRPQVALGDRMAHRPALPGNKLEPFDGGAAAYPRMLAAIENGKTSITLCTYIFDNDSVGSRFVEALAAAAARGVQVRVLIDAIGARYSRRPIHRYLRQRGIRTELFLPTLRPGRQLAFINMRNHRKVLVIDGRLGFTGGMNIRDEFWHPSGTPAARDLHFSVEGPVVRHLQESFAEDWEFASGEALRGEIWFPELSDAGPVVARGISDGPDEDFETVRWILLGALSLARRSVRVVTPYFLPDPGLITALNVTAMRGAEVDVILPERSNLPFVDWATRAQLWQNLVHGCRVFLTPPPFDHSKLVVVDESWALIGSANWDPRSLRLNFEFNVECYDPALAGRLESMALARRASAKQLTFEEIESRPLALRLRDGLARLASPYL